MTGRGENGCKVSHRRSSVATPICAVATATGRLTQPQLKRVRPQCHLEGPLELALALRHREQAPSAGDLDDGDSSRLYCEESINGQHRIARLASASHSKRVERASDAKPALSVGDDRSRAEAVKACSQLFVVQLLAHQCFEQDSDVIERFGALFHHRMVADLDKADDRVSDRQCIHALNRTDCRSRAPVAVAGRAEQPPRTRGSFEVYGLPGGTLGLSALSSMRVSRDTSHVSSLSSAARAEPSVRLPAM